MHIDKWSILYVYKCSVCSLPTVNVVVFAMGKFNDCVTKMLLMVAIFVIQTNQYEFIPVSLCYFSVGKYKIVKNTKFTLHKIFNVFSI